MTPPARLLRLHRNDLTSLLILGGYPAARLDVVRAFHAESPVRHGRLVVVDARREEASLFQALEAWVAARPIQRQCPIGSSDGGTLFIDGIQALGPLTQRMLLAFSKQVCDPDGEEHWVGRLAAGNDQPLSDAVSDGRFSLALLDALDKVRVNMRWGRRDARSFDVSDTADSGWSREILARRRRVSVAVEPAVPS
ncbi:MAG TPA: sigma 54-interacting transcriptional regulator [Usitatibacter sp.]|nr:sigma 54-interacting transcriptional regulator [Usitatibacter sp.]